MPLLGAYLESYGVLPQHVPKHIPFDQKTKSTDQGFGGIGKTNIPLLSEIMQDRTRGIHTEMLRTFELF